MLLLLQLREGITWASAIIGGILGIAAGLSAFLVTRTLYKAQLEEKLTTKYKSLYEAEKADNERKTRVAEEATARANLAEREKADLLLDYTQLTQLFATKSVILEAVTGIYSKMAGTLQSGDPGKLQALIRFLGMGDKEGEDIHRTNPGGGS